MSSSHILSIVTFIYGLAFFGMRITMALESGRSPALASARALRPLAAFGLIHAFAAFFGGTYMIATALARFDAGRLAIWESAARLAAAALIIAPGTTGSIAGFALAALLLVLHRAGRAGRATTEQGGRP